MRWFYLTMLKNITIGLVSEKIIFFVNQQQLTPVTISSNSYTCNLYIRRVAWEDSRDFSTPPLRNERRNSILMTRHYPNLGSASDWLKQISHAAWPIRSTTQFRVVTRHQFGISALVSQTSQLTSFRWKTMVVSRDVGCFLRLVYKGSNFNCSFHNQLMKKTGQRQK